MLNNAEQEPWYVTYMHIHACIHIHKILFKQAIPNSKIVIINYVKRKPSAYYFTLDIAKDLMWNIRF